MSFTNRLSLVLLGVMVAGILAVLFLETSAGPSFRPSDYGSHEECVRNIPVEWAPGSIDRSGAEEACFYVHRANGGDTADQPR